MVYIFWTLSIFCDKDKMFYVKQYFKISKHRPFVSIISYRIYLITWKYLIISKVNTYMNVYFNEKYNWIYRIQIKCNGN